MNYFNSGGSINRLPIWWRPNYITDITNDGIPELIFQKCDVFVIGCLGGRYEVVLDHVSFQGCNGIEAFRDGNQNSIPELVVRVKLTQYIEQFDVIEWDGLQFRSLLVPFDNNVTEEGIFKFPKGRARFGYQPVISGSSLALAISIRGPQPWDDDYDTKIPWRDYSDLYYWNGSNYIFSKQQFDPPTFRFQAVHDGDLSFVYGDYDQAILNFQQAIIDEDLLWYSDERRELLIGNRSSLPEFDPNEYPNLAAYSYFRIMLAGIYKGWTSNPKITYDWLMTNFQAGDPGYVFAELADIFWREYQETNNLSQSCTMTYDIAYLHHEEIFRYLTNSIFVTDTKIDWPNPTLFGQISSELPYSPEFICPSD